MDDISPKLLEQITDDIEKRIAESEEITSLVKLLEDATATYEEANKYAIELGDIVSKALKSNLTEEVLPNGKVYYNIAKKTIFPTLMDSFEKVQSYAMDVQKILNEEAGIGLKVLPSATNAKDRAYGIITKTSGLKSEVDSISEIEWMLEDPITCFFQDIVTETTHANAKLHSDFGIKTYITRHVVGNACEWCKSIAGTYEYKHAPRDVYKRHERCRCEVLFEPSGGKKRNVHTKMWY